MSVAHTESSAAEGAPSSESRLARGLRSLAIPALGATALVFALLALRSGHAAWLRADPDYPSFGRGLLARALVLLGGLGWARLFTERAFAAPRPGALLRGALYLATLWFAALCLEPFSGEAALTWAAAAAGVFALALGAIGPARARAPRLVRGLDVLLANVCLTLVGLELGLTALAAVTPTPLLTLEADTRGRAVYEQNRLRPGADHYGTPANEWGDADGPPIVQPAEACSVVAIGDSFSAGIVPQPYHFTAVAEREGECDVYNMGAPSIGPSEYLYLLTSRAPLLSPDAVIVNLYLFNDVWDAERSETSRAPWLARERRRTYRVGERLWRAFRHRRTEALRAPRAAGPGASLERRFPWLADPMLEQPELSDELYLHVQTRNATRVLSEEVSAPYWPGFFDTLQRMIDVAGERLLFMLLPAEPQVEDAVWDEVLARAEHPLERDGAQRRVGAWLAERGVAYLDVMPALLATPALEDGRRHVFHVRDTHLNARGNEVVGRALAAFLAEQVTP